MVRSDLFRFCKHSNLVKFPFRWEVVVCGGSVASCVYEFKGHWIQVSKSVICKPSGIAALRDLMLLTILANS